MGATARSVRQSGLPSTDYYAPNYRVEIEGQEVDPESRGDILEVKVTMDIENMASFDFTVNNWDDKHITFKYSDTKTFDIGNRVQVHMGYADKLRSMTRGVITSMTPRFPESGPPTIVISGQDNMVKLKDRKPKEGEEKKFVKMTDSQIVERIARRNHLAPQVTETTEVHALVVQKNQDDAQFLMERAKRIDFDCYISVDPQTGKDALYFAKPTDGRDTGRTRVYVLEWGKSLINFNPTLSLAKQVGQVTVRGWDPTTKDVFKYTASAKDLPGLDKGGTSGPDAVANRLQDRQDIVVDQPVTSQEEARALAISLLRERAYEFIKGSGQVIGLPDLRPGDNLEINGLGKRFSGEYYVLKVEHTLGSSGYLTQFEVRKPFDGGTK
jgi:phage protein D